MGPIEQQEIPFEGKRLRNLKRRRGIFLLPAMMTSANLLCGYYAVVASLIGAPEDLDRAAKAIGLAILFDSLDGRIARMTGTTTEFGVQFDSLADVVSFGIAPAILAYAWGFRSVTTMAGEGLHQLGEFAWVGCLAFLICCAWRLARFNVQGMAPGSSKYFVGMPTPAAEPVARHGPVFSLARQRPSVTVRTLIRIQLTAADRLLRTVNALACRSRRLPPTDNNQTRNRPHSDQSHISRYHTAAGLRYTEVEPFYSRPSTSVARLPKPIDIPV